MPKTTSAAGSPATAIAVVVPTCGRMDLLDRCLDALTRQTLPAGGAEIIGAPAPPGHTLAALALVLAFGALLAGAGSLALLAGLAWLALTARLCARRLRGAAPARRPNTVLHLLDMIVTSALIPPLAVFWRLVGAIRYRVRLT